MQSRNFFVIVFFLSLFKSFLTLLHSEGGKDPSYHGVMFFGLNSEEQDLGLVLMF